MGRRNFHEWMPDEGVCPVHGDAECRPCELCGAEFCPVCFPDSMVCPSCAAKGGLDEDAEWFAEEDLWSEKDLLRDGDEEDVPEDAEDDFGEEDHRFKFR